MTTEALKEWLEACTRRVDVYAVEPQNHLFDTEPTPMVKLVCAPRSIIVPRDIFERISRRPVLNEPSLQMSMF